MFNLRTCVDKVIICKGCLVENVSPSDCEIFKRKIRK